MWKKFRFWLMQLFLNMAVSVADKETIEGISLVLAIRDYIKYINSPEADRIRNKYKNEN